MPPQVTVIGGGMITHDQILPSLYQLQRLGRIGEITVCSSRRRTVASLAASETLQQAFPGQMFQAFPESGDPGQAQPELFRAVIGRLPPRQIVVVAVPDALHYDVILAALRHEQHVCAVKPLTLHASHGAEIAREAHARGLMVGVEYHKRCDDRALMARRQYRDGWFGEFRLGTASLFEKWYYRHSNFQNWMTTEHSDAFTYIGCHYVDLVHFITGLLPAAVSVYGIRDRFPNGNQGYLWTDARVLWSNGACLNVQNALGFPDGGPGRNTQGLTLYCQGEDKGALLAHSDQYRGLKYCYTHQPPGEGSTLYAELNPDFFQLVDRGGPGLVPVGYGYRSIESIISACLRVDAEAGDLAGRQKLLHDIDAAGILATPANSSYNERVIEAGRESIQDGGRLVEIRER